MWSSNSATQCSDGLDFLDNFSIAAYSLTLTLSLVMLVYIFSEPHILSYVWHTKGKFMEREGWKTNEYAESILNIGKDAYMATYHHFSWKCIENHCFISLGTTFVSLNFPTGFRMYLYIKNLVPLWLDVELHRIAIVDQSATYHLGIEFRDLWSECNMPCFC